MESPRPSGFTFDALLEAMPDAVLGVEASGTIRFANRQAARMFGYPPGELDGLAIESLVPDGSRAVHVAQRAGYHRNAVVRPMGVGLRLTGLRRDGSELPVEIALNPFDTAEGQIVLCAVRDLSERRRAERMGARARQQQAVAELAKLALGDDVPALIQEAVHAVADVLDVELAQLLELDGDSLRVAAGVGWEPGVVGEARVPLAGSQAGHVARTGEPIAGETLPGEPMLRRHGVVSGVLARVGRPDRVFGVLAAHSRRERDFTPDDIGFVRSAASVLAAALEREASAQAARATREQLEAILDNAPILIGIKGLDGRFMLVNRSYEQVLGVAPDGAIGLTPHDVLPPEVADSVRANDEAVLASGRPDIVEERVVAGGEPRVYQTLKFPLRDASGELYALGFLSTDVTERVEAEARQHRLEAQLARSQRLESVGELAGGIAHDFNNLLAVIANFAGFVAAELPEDSPSRDDIDQILEATRRASELTRRLLLFSRRQPGHPEELDVNGVVAEIEKLLRRTLGDHIDLRTRLDPDLCAVNADRGMIEQVVMNLAINARDAMPDGGVLVIETCNVDVSDDFGAERGAPELRGRIVRLAVTDTGMGMTEDVVARAFEPFFTTKRAEHGTGLGLATVYGIVTQFGGHVDIYSTPGVGSTIKVHLPSTDGRPEDRARSAPAALPRGAGESVLLVEDRDGVRESTRRMLEHHGYRVLEAADGDQALRLAASQEPVDLLLTDVVMPGLSGREVADRVRLMRPGAGIVLMSGFNDESVSAAEVSGAEGYLEKPFTPERLLHVVREALDARL